RLLVGLRERLALFGLLHFQQVVDERLGTLLRLVAAVGSSRRQGEAQHQANDLLHDGGVSFFFCSSNRHAGNPRIITTRFMAKPRLARRPRELRPGWSASIIAAKPT